MALEVHCDRSKPIQSDLLSAISWFTQMIGRRDKVYSPVGKAERALRRSTTLRRRFNWRIQKLLQGFRLQMS